MSFSKFNQDKTKEKNKDFKREFTDVFEGFSNENAEIGQIRKDIAESLTDLQKEIIKINKRIDNIQSSKKQNENFSSILQKADNSPSNDNNEDKYEGVINDISLDSKTKSIKKLLDKGLSDDEICKKLSVGKGEVLLVKGLYKK